MLQPQIIPQGRPTPTTSWLKVQNSDHWPQTAKKYSVVCDLQKITLEKI
jgi:hypothetical protein